MVAVKTHMEQTHENLACKYNSKVMQCAVLLGFFAVWIERGPRLTAPIRHLPPGGSQSTANQEGFSLAPALFWQV